APLGSGADRAHADRGNRPPRPRGSGRGGGMNEIDPETLEIAREEANEGLERIERNLLALEASGENPELIDALFRDSHSIKGAASMVGWNEVASIAHGIEDSLEEPRELGHLATERIEPLLRA